MRVKSYCLALLLLHHNIKSEAVCPHHLDHSKFTLSLKLASHVLSICWECFCFRWRVYTLLGVKFKWYGRWPCWARKNARASLRISWAKNRVCAGANCREAAAPRTTEDSPENQSYLSWCHHWYTDWIPLRRASKFSVPRMCRENTEEVQTSWVPSLVTTVLIRDIPCWYSTRSDAPSTQGQALDQVIALSVHSDTIHDLLGETAFRAIYNLRTNPDYWYNMDSSLQARTRKALMSLEDNEINSIMKLYRSSNFNDTIRSKLSNQLRPYLLSVSSLSCFAGYTDIAVYSHKDYSFLVVRFSNASWRNHSPTLLGHICEFALKSRY